MNDPAPHTNPAPQVNAAAQPPGSLMEVYLESLQLIERLHRRFLDVVKVELDRIGTQDINNIQTLILYNIGDGEMTVGELTSRGYYLGSNVSYNVKKMVENGYLIHERSTHDRRSIRVRLTDKGLVLLGELREMFDRQIANIADGPVSDEELGDAAVALRHLEQFWTKLLAFGPRVPVKIKAA